MTTIHDAPATGTSERTVAWARLRAAAAVFTLAVLVHNFDHVRRGVDTLSKDVFWAGTAALIVEIAIVWLVFAGHRRAPSVSVAGGFSLAAGYLFVHFTPARSWLSDSLAAEHAAAVSWFAASFETIGALLVALAALAVLRAGAASDPAGGDGNLVRALTHPVVLAALVGNAIVLAISFASL